MKRFFKFFTGGFGFLFDNTSDVIFDLLLLYSFIVI